LQLEPRGDSFLLQDLDCADDALLDVVAHLLQSVAHRPGCIDCDDSSDSFGVDNCGDLIDFGDVFYGFLFFALGDVLNKLH